MVNKIISSSIIKQTVREKYDFKKVKCSFMVSGDNDFYLVKTLKGNYVARLGSFSRPWLTSWKEYNFEIDLVNFLKERGANELYVIKKNDGEYITLIDFQSGQRPLLLFNYVSYVKNMKMDKIQSYNYGRKIAKLHLLVKNFKTIHPRFNCDNFFLVVEPLKYIKKLWLSERKNEVNILLKWGKMINDSISDYFKIIPNSIIFGDIHSGNVHFDSNNNPILFDFDLSSYGIQIYDLAVFYWESVFKCNNMSNFIAFKNGYESIRSLSNIENKTIAALALARQIWYIGSSYFYVDKVGKKFYDNDYWNTNLLIIKNNIQLLDY